MPRNDMWNTPPGGSRSPRRIARTILTSFIVGVVSVGMAWAGAAIVPVAADKDSLNEDNDVTSFVGEESGGEEEVATSSYSPADLEPGQILAGATKVSLYPRPEDYKEQFPGARWEQDQSKCEITSPSGVQEGATHVADFRVRWPENPNCLYMGGYGIGPMFSIASWDEEYGLWARSVAMQDANGDALVLTLIDAVYWEAYYNSLCPGEPCGFLDLARQLAEETGLPAKSFNFFSTHSHTAMDFIGGWGAVPKWYMQQATDSLKASVKGALGSMEPAVLEAGENILRARNAERRDFYRSAEDDGLSWFRLIDADDQPTEEVCPGNSNTVEAGEVGNASPAPPPPCEPASPGRAIATVGAYAAHPVTIDAGGEPDGQADADFPAVFAKRVEENFGGVGMFLQTGLGNMSPRGNKIEMGNGMAAAIPAIGSGSQITNTDLTVGRHTWDHPVTNIPLGSLGVTGFFDRTFNETPAAVNVGKSEYPNQKCSSASAVSVETSVSAAKIGNLWITGGPGEVFAGLTNTIEERNPAGVTLALGLANDGLGYIIQSYETDHAGRQGAGFVGGPLAEYEDAYSIDHCFGDATLEYTIGLLENLK